MIDVSYHIRKALYSCLNTNVTYEGEVIKIVDGFSLAEGLSTHHIIIDGVSDTDNDNLSAYSSKVTASLLVVTLVDGFTKDVCDSITNRIKELLQPAFAINGLTDIPADMQVLNLRCSAGRHIEEHDQDGAIIRRPLTIEMIVNHN